MEREWMGQWMDPAGYRADKGVFIGNREATSISLRSERSA